MFLSLFLHPSCIFFCVTFRKAHSDTSQCAQLQRDASLGDFIKRINRITTSTHTQANISATMICCNAALMAIILLLVPEIQQKRTARQLRYYTRWRKHPTSSYRPLSILQLYLLYMERTTQQIRGRLQRQPL